MNSNTTDQIKERVNVTDVVGEYIKLEKAGTNYKALCPFHNEKTPSLMVNTERNFWYCFGCQKGGDIFTFVMEMEGVEFRDALERLAERAGVELPKFSPGEKKARSTKKRTLEILNLAARFYQHQLKNHKKGAEILEYLKNRKIEGDLLDDFKIGYAPEGWSNALDFLSSKGYTQDEIARTGLLVEGQDGQKRTYDRFRGRIMFPVLDISGNVVGFSARVEPGGDESSAKYINTPQTEVYDKSAVLYGLYQGKTDIKKEDSVVVVEGNVDVIASSFAGVKNVVAVSGTALTPTHANIIKRYTQNIRLCFDMDEAGQRATQKSIQTCLQNGLNVEIILLADGQKDVGDLAVADAGSWKQKSQKGFPVMEYFFKKIVSVHDPSDVRTKKSVAKDLLNIIKDIADPLEQSYWLKRLSSEIEVDEEVLTKILEKSNLKGEYEPKEVRANQKIKQIEGKKTRQQILEERLLGLFALYPKELAFEVEKFDHNFSSVNADIWQQIKQGKQPNSVEMDKFAMKVKYIKDEMQGLIEDAIDPLKEWEATANELRKVTKKELLNLLKRDLAKAEERGDEEAADLLMKEYSELSKQT